MTTKQPEVLVPLEELGLEFLQSDQIAAWANVAGVSVRMDYLNRPSVTLADAYEVAASRRQAESEWRDAEARRHTEHAAAVKDLQARCNSAYEEGRDQHMSTSRSFGRRFFGGGPELQGESINAGLEAARMVWASAPDLVRQEITSVTAEESGVINTWDLGTSLPRPIIDAYLHKLARKY